MFLRLVVQLQSEEQMLRLCVFMLKALACQVDVMYKKMVGDLGGMEVIASPIDEKFLAILFTVFLFGQQTYNKFKHLSILSKA